MAVFCGWVHGFRLLLLLLPLAVLGVVEEEGVGGSEATPTRPGILLGLELPPCDDPNRVEWMYSLRTWKFYVLLVPMCHFACFPWNCCDLLGGVEDEGLAVIVDAGAAVFDVLPWPEADGLLVANMSRRVEIFTCQYPLEKPRGCGIFHPKSE